MVLDSNPTQTFPYNTLPWLYIILYTVPHSTNFIPRPPPFLHSVLCSQQYMGPKSNEKQRPGRIYDVSECKVDVGGEEPIFTKLGSTIPPLLLPSRPPSYPPEVMT